jgi:hypothetical protein
VFEDLLTSLLEVRSYYHGFRAIVRVILPLVISQASLHSAFLYLNVAIFSQLWQWMLKFYWNVSFFLVSFLEQFLLSVAAGVCVFFIFFLIFFFDFLLEI